MENPSSPLETLRQLKEMLDAGALTPTEFEALKQRLVFSEPAAAPAPAGPPPVVSGPPVPAPPVAPPPIITGLQAPAPSPAPAGPGPLSAPPAFVPPVFVPPAPAPPAYGAPPVPGFPAAGTAGPASSGAGSAQSASFDEAARPGPLPEPESTWVTSEFADSERPSARNPLALFLSIGGLLALLALVLYLSLNRPPSEHISSTSQTAADSVAAPIETGPQAEQLPPSVATPETIRVVPTNPAPPVQPRPVPALRDSGQVAPAPPADSVEAP